MRPLIRSVGMALVLLMGVVAAASGYEWQSYNGHLYTVTSDWGSWIEAETEAASLGGHLVTINDDDENTWLMNTFQDTYARFGLGDPWLNIAWIGYYSADDGISWQWISGEPVTYYRHDYWDWPYGGIHAYLHLANHPSPGTWCANPVHDLYYDVNIKGIIELDDFTPTSTTTWGKVKALYSLR